MIYFMQCVDGGPVKIGFSGNVDHRRVALEKYYGKSLAVLATMPGSRQREREIHDQFGHLRIERTEQFRPSADLMLFIGRPLLVSANPETVEAMPCVIYRKPLVVQLRGSKEYAEWVAMVAKADGRSLASLVEVAVKHYALSIGFTTPPPPR